MQLSLRSQLIAGVAAIGATTVAITPIAQPELLPTAERVSASVQLAAFDNPVIALLDTLIVASEALFWQAEVPAYSWPLSFYTSDEAFVYAPFNSGLVPSLVNEFSSGPLNAVINNLSGYVDTGLYAANFVLGGVADAVWNTPFALAAAAQLALAGDVEAALAELQNQIVVPLQDGIAVGLDAVGYIVDNVINNVQTVISSTVPRFIAGLVDQVGSAGEFLLQDAVATATAIVSSLTSGDVEGAWNAAVNGLLGPFGLLGSVVELTVGIGVIQDVEGVETVVPPSVRSVLTSELLRLGDFSENGDGGIRNTPYGIEPAPAAAEAAAAEAAAAEVAVEAADSDAPEAVTSGVDVRAASAEAAEAEAASAEAASAEAASASSVRSASSDDSDETGAQAVADADTDGAAAGASEDSAPAESAADESAAAESAADESAAEKPEGPAKKRERASARSAR